MQPRGRVVPRSALAEPIVNASPPSAPNHAMTLGELELRLSRGDLIIPAFWVKGQLLNVRNNGAEYVVTLLGEEFDPRHPERALRFPNSARCQDFVSHWYAREHSDPRAW